MQKKWYGIMLLLGFLASASAQEESEKSDERRVGGTIRVVEPKLHNVEDEKSIKNREVEERKKKEHKKKKLKEKSKIKKEKLEKKNQTKKEKRKEKKEHAEKKVVVSSFKDHVVMAHEYERFAQNQQHHIQKMKHQLADLSTKIDDLEALDRERIHKTSVGEKHLSLINARHAETEKDQKILDYIASRTHGTSEHPDLYELKKKRQCLRQQLKQAIEKQKEYVDTMHDHYAKAELEDVNNHIKAQQKDYDIIYGRLPKKTRKNLNETKDQVMHKRMIEEQRKEHAEHCEKIKEVNDNYKKRARKDKKKKHKAIQEKLKYQDKSLNPVVQKMH